MTKLFIQKKLMLLAFLFLFLGMGTIQAQNFVAPSDAMVKLELKLADVYKEADKGMMSAIDKEIAVKLINKTAMEINSDNTISIALDKAVEVISKDYVLYKDNVLNLKEEITNLLEKKN